MNAHSEDKTYNQKEWCLSPFYLIFMAALFVVQTYFTIAIRRKYGYTLSRQSLILVMSFYICLLAKLIAYVVLSFEIGQHEINDKDTVIVHIVIVSCYLMDFYLYLIFSVAISSMMRIKAMIKLQNSPEDLDRKLKRIRKWWYVFLVFELVSMTVAQSIL